MTLHPDLQKLLDYALQDGEISEKQKEILYKKANELGQDIDLLEMVIEGELQKLNKKNRSEKQTNFACPNCGSSIPKSSIKCSFCGFEISKSTITGGSYIEKLQRELYELETKFADNSSKLTAGQLFMNGGDSFGTKLTAAKVSVISSFSLPNDKEQLIEMFYFCDSNFDTFYSASKTLNATIRQNNSSIASAWSGKAKMAYNKLKRFAAEDDEIKSLIEEYKNRYHVEAKDMKKSVTINQGKGKSVLFGLNKNGVTLGIVLLLFCFPLCWLPFVIPRFKGE